MGRKSTAFTWCIYQKKPWIWTVQSDLLIPELIFLLDITLIELYNDNYITYWRSSLMGWKCMVSKFQVLSKTFILVLNISKDLLIWKIWLCYLPYVSPLLFKSDNLILKLHQKKVANLMKDGFLQTRFKIERVPGMWKSISPILEKCRNFCNNFVSLVLLLIVILLELSSTGAATYCPVPTGHNQLETH